MIDTILSKTILSHHIISDYIILYHIILSYFEVQYIILDCTCYFKTNAVFIHIFIYVLYIYGIYDLGLYLGCFKSELRLLRRNDLTLGVLKQHWPFPVQC